MANIDQVQLPDGSQYHIIDDTSGYATTTYVQDQISTINKNTIGLGNVDNTADINKPVSLPQQDALNGKIDDDLVAYVEGDTTATKRYEVGDQFILNGVLYTATAIIAVNDTIVIGTNCEVSDTLVEQNDALSAQIDTKTDQSLIATIQPNLTAVKAYAKGEQFVYQSLLYKFTTSCAQGGTITIGGNCTLADSVTEQIRSASQRTNYTYTLAEGFENYSSTQNYCYKRNNEIHLHCDIYKGTGYSVGTYYYPLQLPLGAIPTSRIIGTCVFMSVGGSAGTQRGVTGYVSIPSDGNIIVMPMESGTSVNCAVIDIVYPLD